MKSKEKPTIQKPEKKVTKEEKEEVYIEDEMRKSVDSYLKEKGIESPLISLHIFYGAHRTKEDARALSKELDEADIFIPELIGHKKPAYLWSAVSQGHKTPKEAIVLWKKALSEDEGIQRKWSQEEYVTEMFKMLYKKEKVIAFIDLPEHKDYLNKLRNTREFENNLNEGKFSFEEALEHLSESYKQRSEIEKKRENYMLSQLGPQIEKAIKEHPELKDKEKINTLLFLGAFHTRVFHELKKRGDDIKRKFIETPLYFPFQLGIMRGYHFDKIVTREQKEKALLEFILDLSLIRGLKKFVSNTIDLIVYFGKISQDFSSDEVREIYETYAAKRREIEKKIKLAPDWRYKGGKQDDEKIKKWVENYKREIAPLERGLEEYFVEVLHKKGISIPKTSKELKEFLGK